MNGLLWQRKPQKPQANDTISLGMIGSDLVLRLVHLLLVSTSPKIKKKTLINVRVNCKTERKEKLSLNHFIYTVGLVS